MGPPHDRGHRGHGDLGKGPASEERAKAEKPVDFLVVFIPGLLGPEKTWTSFYFFFFLIVNHLWNYEPAGENVCESIQRSAFPPLPCSCRGIRSAQVTRLCGHRRRSWALDASPPAVPPGPPRTPRQGCLALDTASCSSELFKERFTTRCFGGSQGAGETPSPWWASVSLSLTCDGTAGVVQSCGQRNRSVPASPLAQAVVAGAALGGHSRASLDTVVSVVGVMRWLELRSSICCLVPLQGGLPRASLGQCFWRSVCLHTGSMVGVAVGVCVRACPWLLSVHLKT